MLDENDARENEAYIYSVRKETHEKSIALLQIANLFSPYIALALGVTVARDVRLRYNANGFIFHCHQRMMELCGHFVWSAVYDGES
ncbi:hypothetical protein TNCV_122131 [Trichonephila clavipes]|nr:hypothetical protein TNCV_122131 [Trichonephila clavipes]